MTSYMVELVGVGEGRRSATAEPEPNERSRFIPDDFTMSAKGQRVSSMNEEQQRGK